MKWLIIINVAVHWVNFLLEIISGCTSHYSDVIMGSIASQIPSLKIVYSSVYSGTDQRKHQSSASLAFVRGIHWRPVNSPHKGLVTRKMFPFDDVIMFSLCRCWTNFQDDSTNYYLIINSLTHSGQMASWKLVRIDSGNGLVPHSNKTINLTNIDLSSVTSYGIQLRTISQEMLKISVLDMRLKITNLRSQLFFSQGPMSLKIDQNEQHLYALICVWCGLEYIRG